MTDPFACDPVPEHELAERRHSALAEAEARGLDGLLIWSRCGEPGGSADIQYFANHFSPFPWVPPASPAITACEHAALVLTTSGAGGLAVSGYSSPEVTLEDVRNGMDLDALTTAMLSDYGLSQGRVGVIGAGVLPYASAQALHAAAPGLQLVDVDDISHTLRRRLSEWEIGVLRAAGRLGVDLTSTLIENATPGGTEGAAVGAALARAATVPGCVHWAFLVGSGDKADAFVAADQPAWRPGYTYRPDDLLHFDCYGMLHGYPYDLARTVVLGEATAAQQRTIDGAKGLCAAMAAVIKPGVTARVLHRAGVEYLADQGLSAGQIPGFGHGMGCGFTRPYFGPPRPTAPTSIWSWSRPPAWHSRPS